MLIRKTAGSVVALCLWNLLKESNQNSYVWEKNSHGDLALPIFPIGLRR
jgi:hypothetical protein